MLLQAHPTGNAFVHNLAEGLAADSLLAEFWTCLDYPAQDRWLRVLPDSWLAEARRRQLPSAVKPFAHLQMNREIVRLLGHRAGLGSFMSHETSPWSVDGVYRALDRRVARRIRATTRLRGVYLYEDGAESAFAAAHTRGLRTFYDLPIGYWRAARRILGEEAQYSPEWAATMESNFDSAAKLTRKDRELALADTVFVASSFTQATLKEAPTAPADVILVPYGAPALDPVTRPATRKPGTPLRVLFVGSLGQRKGLRYLLEAMDSLGTGFELTLIGKAPGVRCDPLTDGLRRHRHIASLPHAGILREMRQHHVFVFPSLFEGFGLVLLEAMACGLPIVATPHTAAPDLITDGREGFIVPIRSAGTIAEKLTLLADDENRRQSMAASALLRAGEITWDSYRHKMAAEIRQRLFPPMVQK
jgi:glycosyltransferase involved in cell wall biosynthesis